MCKCCQSILESCYWHCFERWFCYDETIATYEDPLSSSNKENKGCDNLAFWDSVQVIANRSVVTIQPLPTETEAQPTKEFESTSVVDGRVEIRKARRSSCSTIITDDRNENTNNDRKSTVEGKLEKRMPENVKLYKTLKDRRTSAANLKLYLSNDFHEIPIIRQSSVPKFYMDTPDVPQDYDSSRPSSVLMSPVLPNTPTIHYDLKSIVQFEKEQEVSKTPQTTKRMTQIKRKMKPMLSKKASSKSLPGTINYI